MHMAECRRAPALKATYTEWNWMKKKKKDTTAQRQMKTTWKTSRFPRRQNCPRHPNALKRRSSPPRAKRLFKSTAAATEITTTTAKAAGEEGMTRIQAANATLLRGVVALPNHQSCVTALLDWILLAQSQSDLSPPHQHTIGVTRCVRCASRCTRVLFWCVQVCTLAALSSNACGIQLLDNPACVWL